MKNLKTIVLNNAWQTAWFELNKQVKISCRNQWTYLARNEITDQIQLQVFMHIINKLYQSNKE